MMSASMQQRRRYVSVLLPVGTFVVSWAYLINDLRVGGGRDNPPFHIDEAHKLGESYYWHLFFERRDLNHPAWRDDFYARTNPPIAKYLFGAGLALAGYHVHDQQLQTDFEALWRRPTELRQKVPDGMLRVSRGLSATFAAGVCALVCVIAMRISGASAGVIAALLLLLNPYFAYYGRLGLTDSILLFFMTLTVPVMIWAAGAVRREWMSDRPAGGWGHRLLITIAAGALPGLVVGLATGTKLNGAMAGGVVSAGFALIAVFPARTAHIGWGRRLGIPALCELLAIVVAIGLFVGLNPYYHAQPLSRFVETLRTYQDWTLKQQVDPGGGLLDVCQRTAAVGYFSLRSTLLPFAHYMDGVGVWLAGLVFVFGLIVLAVRSWRSLPLADHSKGTRSLEASLDLGTIVVMIWVILYVVGTLCWLPLAWRRYLLVPYVPVTVAEAVGLAELVRALARLTDNLGTWDDVGARLVPVLGIVGAGLMSAALVMTSWIITPERLEPEILSEIPLPTLEEMYVAAAKQDPNEAVFHYHQGLALMRRGIHRRAAACFEKAMHTLPPASEGDSATTIRRCRISYDLARARTAAGQSTAAAGAWRDHMRILEMLVGAMVSHDPKVRAEFEQLIDERRP